MVNILRQFQRGKSEPMKFNFSNRARESSGKSPPFSDGFPSLSCFLLIPKGPRSFLPDYFHGVGIARLTLLLFDRSSLHSLPLPLPLPVSYQQFSFWCSFPPPTTTYTGTSSIRVLWNFLFLTFPHPAPKTLFFSPSFCFRKCPYSIVGWKWDHDLTESTENWMKMVLLLVR